MNKEHFFELWGKAQVYYEHNFLDRSLDLINQLLITDSSYKPAQSLKEEITERIKSQKYTLVELEVAKTLPIFIYQVGKVGSSSLLKSFEILGFNKIFHVHKLSSNPDDIMPFLKKEPHMGHLRRGVEGSKLLREFYQSKNVSTRWKMISLIRDPISRAVSSFFQNLSSLFPNFESEFSSGKLTLEMMVEYFQTNRFALDVGVNWFENSMKKFVNIDVFQEEFNQEKQYQWIQTNHFDLLLFKLETLNQAYLGAFEDVFNIPNFDMYSDNISTDKAYAELKKEFTKHISYSNLELDQIYNSKSIRHFYTNAEIENFKQKWRCKSPEQEDLTGLIKRAAPKEYKVSVIVSTYASEEFIEGCLEDLTEQSIFTQCEIIVINSGSPEDEDRVIRQYIERYDNITYLHTKRETLYEAWNRGIKISQAPYISNANTDDRHRHDHLQVLSHELDTHPKAAVAYGDVLKVEECVPFNEAKPTGIFHRQPHCQVNLLRSGEMGNQPMWRKSVHAEVGYFNPKYTIVGDYEMWCRVSEKHDMVHVNEPLGYFCIHDGQLQDSNLSQRYYHFMEVKYRHLDKFLKVPHVPKDEALIKEFQTSVNQQLNLIKSGQPIEDWGRFERDFFGLAVYSYKQGNLETARNLCADYLVIVGQALNMVALCRYLNKKPIPLKHNLHSNPLISVIIPLYNLGEFLEEAVVSVVNQNYIHWEIIIVDDGSTDNSLDIAHQVKSKYDSYAIEVIAQPNQGKGKCRNSGLRGAQGELLVILDADDEISSNYFEEAVWTLEQNPSVSWVIPKTLQFGPLNNKLYWTWEYSFLNSLIACPTPVTAVFKKSMLNELGGFDDTMLDREDWEFWMRAGEQGYLAKTTSSVCFMYRKAIERWGEREDVNLQSKKEIYERHKWAYKDLPESMLTQYFSVNQIGAFPVELLKDEVRHAFEQIGNNMPLVKQKVLEFKK